MTRIYLSPPHLGPAEKVAMTAALDSGWVAPIGPDINAFESAIAKKAGRQYAVALSSGTAAIHLGLKSIGVNTGDQVIVPTLTFGATAFAVIHAGAKPIFLDVEEESWNLDPVLLESILEAKLAKNDLPSAVVPVDLFGRPANYQDLLPVCSRFGIPVLVDSAESLGASYNENPAGSEGSAAVFSFNGNKIITTGGGGALVTDQADIAQKVRFWSTQSREPFPWYEHKEIGFNYRLSNVLAALGKTQMEQLDAIISRRRNIRNFYERHLGCIPGITVMGDPPWGKSNGWLTTVRFDASVYPDAPNLVREALEAHDIESRPVWKPMHQQPVFSLAESHLTGVSDRIFDEGLCLPSGTGLGDNDLKRIVSIIQGTLTN